MRHLLHKRLLSGVVRVITQGPSDGPSLLCELNTLPGHTPQGHIATLAHAAGGFTAAADLAAVLEVGCKQLGPEARLSLLAVRAVPGDRCAYHSQGVCGLCPEPVTEYTNRFSWATLHCVCLSTSETPLTVVTAWKKAAQFTQRCAR